ncbi:MAG: DUF6785 family protein [Armatimonadota bacterium]
MNFDSEKTSIDESSNPVDYSPKQHKEAHSSAPAMGITRRAIVLGVILSILHTCWVIYEELVFKHITSTDYSLLPTVMGLILVLLFVNSFLKRFAPKMMLTPGELMVVFVMTTISAIVNGHSFSQNLFTMVLWPHYMGVGNKDLDKYISAIPSFIAPSDPAIVKQFFEGTRDPWRFLNPDILQAWSVSIVFWAVFLFMLIWTMICIGSILRKQWVDREKLTFPIIDLPISMVQAETAGVLFKNRLFSIGFAISAVLLSLNYLSGIFPSIPSVNLHVYSLGSSIFVNPPATGMNPITMIWWPYAFGLAYLIPLDISFSCWFFYVFIRLSMLAATALGLRDANAGYAETQFPYFQTISQGAWVGMFIVLMWGARGHLKNVWQAVKDGGKSGIDSDEPIRYRTAFIGIVIGAVTLIALAVASGMRLHVALLFFGIYFMAVVAMTRIYAQIAVPQFSMGLFYNSTAFVTSLTGTTGVTRAEASMLTNVFWTDFTYRQHPMGHGLESMVFADKVHKSRRQMFQLVVAALAIGVVVGLFTTLQIFYEHGAASAKIEQTPIWLSGMSWNRLIYWNSNPQSVEFWTIAKMVISGAIVFLLAWIRNVWFGFPLHPIGYLFATCFAVEWIWNIILVTWLIKVLVIRYGGLSLYRKSLPLFFGIALGDAAAQLFWGVVLGFLGVQGATPYGPPH